MIYAYGATVVEIVRRKEFCEYSKPPILLDADSRIACSSVLLSPRSEHTGGHGQALVSGCIYRGCQVSDVTSG